MADLDEKLIHIDARGTLLEGRLQAAAGKCGAVITHPHPLYGGDMNNPVVETIARTYHCRGWTTLRFNFRGTGNSQGAFDNGEGEQMDIDAAIACLAKRGVRKIELAGYSFGSWVISHWTQQKPGHGHVIRLVAPPVAFMDFRTIQRIDGLQQVVVGSRDDFAPASLVEQQVQTWQPGAKLQVIDNADHFFWNHMPELQTALLEFIPA